MTMIRVLMLLVLAGGLSSCGMGFRKEWDRAEGMKSDGLNGRWAGTWKSDVNGHTGFLRCVVSEGPKPGTRTFLYRAGWMKVLAMTISTDKAVTRTPQGWEFRGSKDLGRFGGEFRSKGTVKGDEFSATYDSSLDKGTFAMKRQ